MYLYGIKEHDCPFRLVRLAQNATLPSKFPYTGLKIRRLWKYARALDLLLEVVDSTHESIRASNNVEGSRAARGAVLA